MRPRVKIELIAPLMMFYYDSDKIPFDLGNGFKISFVEKSEIEQLFGHATTISEYERSEILGHARFAITKSYMATEIEAAALYQTVPFMQINEHLSLLKMALGLVRGTNTTFPIFHLRADRRTVLFSASYDRQPTHWRYDDVTFLDNDLRTVRTLVRKISPLVNIFDSRLMNACVYFETGRRSSEYITRFTMFVAALEALFNSSTDHISETITLRCAWIVGKNHKQRIDYYHRIRAVYKMRSYLIHGQDLEGNLRKHETQQKLIKDAEYFSRQALLTIFSRNQEYIFDLKKRDFNSFFAANLLR